MDETSEVVSQEPINPEQEEAAEAQAVATENVEELRGKFQKALAQKKVWREKALEAQEKLKTIQPQVELRQNGGSQGSYATKDEMDEMYLASKGYNDEELKSLHVLAKGSGKRLREVSGMPEAEAIISFMRNKAKTQGTTPPPSQHVSVPSGQQKPLAQMNETERREWYGQKAEEIRRRGK